MTGGQAATVGAETGAPLGGPAGWGAGPMQFQVEAPKFAYAPVETGMLWGDPRYINGDLVYQSPLAAAEDVSAVQRQTNGLFHWIGGLFGQ